MSSLRRQFTSKDHGPVVQFIKYSIGGALATIVHIGVFYLCAFFVLPSLGANDPLIRLFHLHALEMTDALRATNAKWDNVIAFCFSNLTAYLVNIAWVFHTGRQIGRAHV